jgi:hypothetical protein
VCNLGGVPVVVGGGGGSMIFYGICFGHAKAAVSSPFCPGLNLKRTPTGAFGFTLCPGWPFSFGSTHNSGGGHLVSCAPSRSNTQCPLFYAPNSSILARWGSTTSHHKMARTALLKTHFGCLVWLSSVHRLLRRSSAPITILF